MSDVFAPEDLLDEALKTARRIAKNGPLAVQIVKKLAVETSHMAPADFILTSNDAWGLWRKAQTEFYRELRALHPIARCKTLPCGSRRSRNFGALVWVKPC